ncbi:MAG: hypothetical protein DWQ08_00825 [Proteobacteria bacterium]|nr:MAG: hypothetical protein DWQ08_00825 [Pseudomonadota bacterium]
MSSPKVYSGKRTIDGLVVTVNGDPLDERFDIEVYDDKGFEWSYDGSAPRQLALAILADYLGDADKARRHVDRFTTAVVANLDNDWTLDGDEIDKVLA